MRFSFVLSTSRVASPWWMVVSLLSRATVRDSFARTSLLKSRPSTCPPFTWSPARIRHSWIRPMFWLEPTRVECL